MSFMPSIACPSCGIRLAVREELAGKNIQCPKCRKVFQVPTSEKPEGEPKATESPHKNKFTLFKRDIIIAAACLVIGGMLGLCIGIPIGRMAIRSSLFSANEPSKSTPSDNEPSKSVMTREEFRQAVLWKSTNDVIQSVGRPDRTQDSGGSQYWYYEKRTKDPVSGKVDRSVQVVIQNGFVESVNFT
jgi:hypothetical protein